MISCSFFEIFSLSNIRRCLKKWWTQEDMNGKVQPMASWKFGRTVGCSTSWKVCSSRVSFWIFDEIPTIKLRNLYYDKRLRSLVLKKLLGSKAHCCTSDTWNPPFQPHDPWWLVWGYSGSENVWPGRFQNNKNTAELGWPSMSPRNCWPDRSIGSHRVLPWWEPLWNGLWIEFLWEFCNWGRCLHELQNIFCR